MRSVFQRSASYLHFGWNKQHLWLTAMVQHVSFDVVDSTIAACPVNSSSTPLDGSGEVNRFPAAAEGIVDFQAELACM
jgi:hypothetical protein